MADRIVNSVFLDEQIFTKDGPATIVRAGKSVAGATTDSVVIAAVTGKKIRVIWLYLVAVGGNSNCAIRTKPAGAGTDLGAPYDLLTASGPYVSPAIATIGYHETNAGEGLAISTGANQVNINVICVLI